MRWEKYLQTGERMQLLQGLFLIRISNLQFYLSVSSRLNSTEGASTFIWKELNKGQKELTLQEISKISKSMGNIFFLFITGGEPFLRDDIDKIVEIYYKNNNVVNLNLPTNGTLPDVIYKKCKSILEKCPDLSMNLSISIDDFPEYHDENRGVKGILTKQYKHMKN